MAKIKLVPAVCRRCKRTITHTLPGAMALCARCGVWAVATDPGTDRKPPGKRKPPPATRETRAEEWEQLTLF